MERAKITKQYCDTASVGTGQIYTCPGEQELGVV